MLPVDTCKNSNIVLLYEICNLLRIEMVLNQYWVLTYNGHQKHYWFLKMTAVICLFQLNSFNGFFFKIIEVFETF